MILEKTVISKNVELSYINTKKFKTNVLNLLGWHHTNNFHNVMYQ